MADSKGFASGFVSEVLDEIVTRIGSGDLDEQLDSIEKAVVARRKHALVDSIHTGSRVRLNMNTRPAYMRGLPGTVVKINDQSVRVKFDDDPDGRFPQECRVPLSLVELI